MPAMFPSQPGRYALRLNLALFNCLYRYMAVFPLLNVDDTDSLFPARDFRLFVP